MDRVSCGPVSALRFGLLHQAAESFLSVDWLDSSAFQIVIAPIKYFPRNGQLIKQADYGVFHQLVASASGVPRHLLKPRPTLQIAELR